LTRQTATRVAFTAIALFVLAQVTWWIIVQGRLADDLRDTTLSAFERDARAANALLDVDPGAAAELLARYEHLLLRHDEAGVRLELDPAARAAVAARHARMRRMLAFEGPFFALVVFGLLLFIAASLRAERELKRRQTNFVGAVTHEFSTPISTLRLLVQTLRLRPPTRERQQAYLRQMEAEIDRLERTSEQVLASARLEQASEPPALAAVELGSVVRHLVERLRPSLELRGALLTLHEAPEPLPVALDGDAFALALSNLLDNAVKYNPADVRPVALTLERDGDLVCLHVDDEGVGIATSERTRVFERFYRTGDELRRESTGVGLGLSLVKSTIEAMRGWVRIADGPSGRGTRFTVVLPRRVSLAANESEAPSGAGGAPEPPGAPGSSGAPGPPNPAPLEPRA
jgi:two-component system, OmpR family, sensor histidine kinase SenX3